MNCHFNFSGCEFEFIVYIIRLRGGYLGIILGISVRLKKNWSWFSTETFMLQSVSSFEKSTIGLNDEE